MSSVFTRGKIQALNLTSLRAQKQLKMVRVKYFARFQLFNLAGRPVACLNKKYFNSFHFNIFHSPFYVQIRWGARLIDGEASFFSISGDGRVVQWAVMPGELQATTIITLHSSVPPIPGPDGTLITVNSML